jgi:hypothetical protein
MKAVITKITFNKEYETKFGTMNQFDVWYDEKRASFSSKSNPQNVFIEGQENEFTEEPREYNGKTYITIKPIKKQWNNSGYGKAVKKEQSKYSGFAVSYVKDLIIADKLDIKQWKQASKDIFDFMVELDKSIEV